MNPRLRSLLTFAVLGMAIFIIAWQFRRLLDDRSIFPPDDFVEYWAAGRLNAQGDNPYDPEKLLPLERLAGRDTDEAIMMWNPPWTLTLVMPIGVIKSRTAQLLWLLLGFGLIGIGADCLWRIYDGPAEKRWVAWLLAFTYMPTFFVLGAGQIGPWVLAGAVLFLLFLRQGWLMLAGAATVLLAIKPHLAYLFWIVLLVWGVRRGNWKVLLGGAFAGIVAMAIPLLFNPDVFGQYVREFRERPPTRWLSPTLGAVIRMIEGPDRFGQQFIPALLGLGWLSWHSWQHKNEPWDWSRQMPLLLLVSFVTASYGAWPFDLVILLPAVVQVSARIARQPKRGLCFSACIIWISLNLVALVMNMFAAESFWFIWMAPMMLASYLVLMRKMDRK